MLKDFYPTPRPLISKMISGIDFNKIKYVLEPSAGKGDICDILKTCSDDFRKFSIDTIEIDPNLQYILKGKGYNLVFDDFLSFNTSKHYELIIANFPFSDGDKHLIKALELLENFGGNLVCLVNAETIKNPFTNLRITLDNKLREYNAQIEYIEDAFVDSERKTNVEVALIKLSVVKDSFSSLIIDNLKKSEEVKYEKYKQDQLVEADFIKSIISRFIIESKLGVNLIKEFFALKPFILDKISKSEDDTKYSNPLIDLKIGDANDYNGDYVNQYLRGLRKKYWEVLIGDSRFTSKYTSNIISELYTKLEQLKDYDFNLFNIQQLTNDLNGSITLGIEDAIMKLFDELSNKHAWYQECNNNIHYYNGWASNKAHKINKKVILPVNGFSSYSWDKKDKLETHYIKERINDMVKVFNYFNNEVKDVYQLVGNRIENANQITYFRNIDFYYFEATFYKKGTCHIVFKDQKLLDKFNIFGSRKKGWLPPSYGKKKYNEMTEDEQTVIDDFQGSMDYAKVMTRPDEYIIESSQLLLN